jgi:hypothetical protein
LEANENEAIAAVSMRVKKMEDIQSHHWRRLIRLMLGQKCEFRDVGPGVAWSLCIYAL